MVFPNSYLPTTSQPWGREVQKRIELAETAITRNETNNDARDTQLAASMDRLSTTVLAASAAATKAQEAIDNVISVEEAVYWPGTTEINGNNIRANTIAANKISAGTLTGFTIQSAASGPRIEISGTTLRVYDATSQVASIYGDSTSLIINGGTNSINVGDLGIAIIGGTTSSILVSDSGTYVTGNGTFYNNLSVSGVSTLSGEVRSPDIYNANTSQAYNVNIQGSGFNYRIYRSTFASSRELKRDIRPLSFDKDAYINISPVVFKYIDGVLREEEKDWDIVGFIAEDFIDAGFGEHLVTPAQDEDDHISLRYDKMYMFLHSVVKSQQETIKDLTSRLEQLEGK